MLPTSDLGRIAYAAPEYLWLLGVPLVLLLAWVRRLMLHSADVRHLHARRTLPVRQRLSHSGGLFFWLFQILAVAALVVALARPVAPAIVVRDAGVDLIILQDASASMHVADVPGNRWQRSIRFLRTLANSLSWNHDRMAMAVFARIAAPQIRLTTDPNTFFFFADHLYDSPPFRLEDDSTWDTNLEQGIHWGLRLVERDEALHGRSLNAKLFVLVTDGEAWSGAVEDSLDRAVDRDFPVFVVGIGTLGGGRMPPFIGPDGEEQRDPDTPQTSRLDRAGLRRIAARGGGRYFELERDPGRYIANTIIDAGRRRAPSLGTTTKTEPLYWYCLVWAGLLSAAGLIFVRERAHLWLQLACVGGTIAFLLGIL